MLVVLIVTPSKRSLVLRLNVDVPGTPGTCTYVTLTLNEPSLGDDLQGFCSFSRRRPGISGFLSSTPCTLSKSDRRCTYGILEP